MRRSTSNRTSGRLFDNPSIRGLSLGALDPYVRRQVRGTRPTILFFSAAGRTVPDFLARWVNGKGLTIVPVPDPADVEQRVLRSLPQLVVIDADGGPQGLGLCTRLKADSYSAIVPVAVLTSRHTTDRVQEWFTAGADEVISPLFEPTEQASRLDGLMTRTARDVAVNPSTRLPGTTEIEREIRRRMENGELFAVCYADLDHFKEYNDRYSYNDGDRVIYILSRILHDVVKGLLGNRGFIGHIGGDDFIFIIPFDAIPDVCGEVLEVFDTLVPYQYNEQDRRAGYYFGKDRRGQRHQGHAMQLAAPVLAEIIARPAVLLVVLIRHQCIEHVEHLAAHRRDALDRQHADEVIAADVSDKTLLPEHATHDVVQDAGEQVDHPIAVVVAVAIVVFLEVVQFGVA